MLVTILCFSAIAILVYPPFREGFSSELDAISRIRGILSSFVTAAFLFMALPLMGLGRFQISLLLLLSSIALMYQISRALYAIGAAGRPLMQINSRPTPAERLSLSFSFIVAVTGCVLALTSSGWSYFELVRLCFFPLAVVLYQIHETRSLCPEIRENGILLKDKLLSWSTIKSFEWDIRKPNILRIAARTRPNTSDTLEIRVPHPQRNTIDEFIKDQIHLSVAS